MASPAPDPPEKTGLPPLPCLRYRGDRLELDGQPVDELAAKHGTPFFVFSERRLLDNYRALRDGFAAGGHAATLRYCAKTNHEAGILRPLAHEGAGLLASHGAEVDLALACGFPPERIAYQRPAPPPGEVSRALAAGATHLHVFRPEDAARFAALASAAGRRAELSFRLRPDSRSLSPLAGLNARLGLTIAEARQAARAIASSPSARLRALNVYIGTQQAGAGSFEHELRRACELARALRADGSAVIEEINLGGGAPSPSLIRLGLGRLWARWRDRSPKESNGTEALAEFARRLGARFGAACAAAGLDPAPALALEPGRSIVGNAALLVSRVVAVEGRWLFLDASRNFLGESPLLFRRELYPLRRREGERERFFHLSGSTLNTTDVLDFRRRLPRLAAGDLLAFGDAGAYSISRAARYAGLSPSVLLLESSGAVREIRRPERFSDLAAPMEPGLAGPDRVERAG